MTFIKKYPEYLLFMFFAMIGIFTASSYGFAWDEFAQRSIGENCYNYIVDGNVYYLTCPERDHGAIFEFSLFLIEKMLSITENRGIYQMRHMVTNLFFILSAVYFYKLIFFIYNKKSLAIIGFLMLVINPTLYGHSFFNSKDIPFLSLFIICFYQFAIAFKQKKYYQFILLGLFSGLTINIRIMGILFVAFVIFFLLYDLLFLKKEKGLIKKHILLILIYATASIAITIATWPLLWENPVENFIYAFNNLSKYPWDGTTLFNGELVRAESLGWDYIPTWFLINTPIIYLIFGFCGLALFLFITFKKIKKIDFISIDRNNLLYVLCFTMPVFSVIILHSVLYDTWRHLFYIYPAFIMLAVYFLNYCMNTKYKLAAQSIATLSIASVMIFIISNFPFHHVYFNQFISWRGNDYIKTHYEMDYWGVSYNKALEYVLEIDKSDTVRISADNPTIMPNADMLEDDERKRILFVDSVFKSDYFVATYRWHPEGYYGMYNNIEEQHSFEVLGSKINTIFKVKK